MNYKEDFLKRARMRERTNLSQYRLIDAANISDSRPYVPLQMVDFPQLVTDYDRSRIISASRKLYHNLGPARAPILQRTDYAIGNAWIPKFQGENTKWGEKAKDWLTDEWFKNCDIRGSDYDFGTALHNDSLMIDRDGDIGVVLTRAEDGYPQLQRILAHRIGNRGYGKYGGINIQSGPYAGCQIKSGVITDRRGSPVAYRVLGTADDGSEDRDYPRGQLMLIYNPDTGDQCRGLPVLTHAINDLLDLMHTQGFEKQAAMIASAIGLLEWNDSGTPEDYAQMVQRAVDPELTNAANQDILTKNLFGGMVRYFRSNSGGKLESLKNDRPGGTWESFMDRLIRNACSGVPWPYELAWKAEGLTGTTNRLVLSQAMHSVGDRQSLLLPRAVTQVSFAIACAIEIGILPQSADWNRWGFTMPPRMTVDYGRDKHQDREDYKAGLTNLGDILEEQGLDIDQHYYNRAMEAAKRKLAAVEVSELMGVEITPLDMQLLTPNANEIDIGERAA